MKKQSPSQLIWKRAWAETWSASNYVVWKRVLKKFRQNLSLHMFAASSHSTVFFQPPLNKTSQDLCEHIAPSRKVDSLARGNTTSWRLVGANLKKCPTSWRPIYSHQWLTYNPPPPLWHPPGEACWPTQICMFVWAICQRHCRSYANNELHGIHIDKLRCDCLSYSFGIKC